MLPEQSRIFSAWISGYVDQKKGRTWIDFKAYQRSVADLKQWCASHPKEVVVTGLEQASGIPSPK
jgi:hypothetical protein